jgi:predicted phage tail protein
MFAIIGIFYFGVVFGALAITNSGMAEALGVRAPFGRVCGWIVTVLGVSISLVVSLFLLGVLQALTGTYSN